MTMSDARRCWEVPVAVSEMCSGQQSTCHLGVAKVACATTSQVSPF